MREIEIEEWRDIKGFEGYQISSFGRIKSLEKIDYLGHHRKEKILKPSKTKDGYLKVALCKDGEKKSYYIHRLVGNAFLQNPYNLPLINHINEIKTDNRVENLEWCDSTYNVRYSQAKPVNQFTKDGKFIRRWDCINEIQYQLGFSNGHIIKCCQGKLKSSYGFKWFYADDLLQPEPPLF